VYPRLPRDHLPPPNTFKCSYGFLFIPSFACQWPDVVNVAIRGHGPDLRAPKRRLGGRPVLIGDRVIQATYRSLIFLLVHVCSLGRGLDKLGADLGGVP
jgi:hypothetical protein